MPCASDLNTAEAVLLLRHAAQEVPATRDKNLGAEVVRLGKVPGLYL